MTRTLVRSLLPIVAAGLLSALSIAPAAAREGVSIGGGVKCSWVLVSSVGGVNTYTQVCRKGP